MFEDAIYEIGDMLKDRVTGCQGVVLAITFYSTGCIHYGLCRQMKEDGFLPEWEWFDQSRLEMVNKGVVEFNITPEKPGGPFPNAPQT